MDRFKGDVKVISIHDIHRHSFGLAWGLLKKAEMPEEWYQQALEHGGATDDYGIYDFTDPEKHQAMIDRYGFKPFTASRDYIMGPGKEKMKAEMERVRGRLDKFGSKMVPLVDWERIMEMEGVPSNQWDQIARDTVGSLSDTDKVGIASGTPTAACPMGSALCGTKCYAKSLERREPAMRALLNHYKMLGDNPARHGSAMSYLLNRDPSKEFRGNWSGDYQNVGHIAQALSIAAATPNVEHWLHTREIPALLEYLSQFEEGSQEWIDAIPPNARFRLSQTHDRMTSGPEGGGIRGDEMGPTATKWRMIQGLDTIDPRTGETRSHQKHPQITGTEVGTAPREGAFMCPVTMKPKHPETGEKLINPQSKTTECGQFGCNVCQSKDIPVIYSGNWTGHPNTLMADKHGVKERHLTSEQLAHEQAKAFGMWQLAQQQQPNIGSMGASNVLDPRLNPQFYD